MSDRTASSWAEFQAELLARPRSSLTAGMPVLNRVTRTLALAGDPHRTLAVIHVTGTNAKTTTARIIDALLSSAGLTVARFTGPHLASVGERITLAGAPVSERQLQTAHAQLAPALAEVDEDPDGPLPFFATLTALALTAFAQAQPDVAVIEVGIGGREDATNIIDAEVAVLCPIGLDHADRLGGSLSAIAGHKAGIIKPGATVVVAPQPVGVPRIIRREAARVGADYMPVHRRLSLTDRRPCSHGQTFSLRGYGATHRELELALVGGHQAENAMTAVVAAQEFLARRGQTLGHHAITRGLAWASAPGRLEWVSDDPPVVVDVSHNPAGMTVTAAALSEAFGPRRPLVVFAAAQDKDAAGMLRALAPSTQGVILTRSGPRGWDPDELTRIAGSLWQSVQVVHDPAAAIEQACARPEPAVLITGSFAIAGAARERFRAQLRAAG